MGRLEVIAGMVREGMVLADIGTDHARLPIMLVEQGIINRAYACDVAAGPLRAAEENIHQAHLQQQILTVRSDGFRNVPEDANAAVIAGMGFFTIRDIIDHDIEKLKQFQQLIIESNTDLTLLRTWISDHHWTIVHEVLIHERSHDYVAMEISLEFHEAYSSIELQCGPILLQQKSEAYLQYCKRQISKLDLIIEKISDQTKQDSLKQERELWIQASEN
ncbi:MAG: class I SAM-dependent methyltransferase [Solobacterium sp.]|jgi:tRNA (adenine22-N1)-methyltransferase|nr:class I SAM-dependent methyltransferase [Solobacterium sp.]MCH4222961.1 class I SAM-dependent methyltransferase [Solobacterium sp.]MCH4266370.1 class I SAM-dependent methyltransferase [Solobacterium sp.]